MWDAVHDKAMRLDVASPTGASSDAYRRHAESLRTLEDRFPAQPGQCGAILGIGNAVCMDAVSRPDAFARLWPKLRRGYMLDALDRLDGARTPNAHVELLVSDTDRADWRRRSSAGLGADVRLSGPELIGSGLELEGELLQLSAFRSEDGRAAAVGRIARPSGRA